MDEAMETAARAIGVGYPPEHFNGAAGAAGATKKNVKHPHREYNKVASEVSERDQASAGPVAGEEPQPTERAKHRSRGETKNP